MQNIHDHSAVHCLVSSAKYDVIKETACKEFHWSSTVTVGMSLCLCVGERKRKDLVDG